MITTRFGDVVVVTMNSGRIGMVAKGGGRMGAGGAVTQVAPLGVASFSTGMGKGLREPCSPFRECIVFGAELNVPDADDWNCAPIVVDPATSFNLSGLEVNHEVVVALLTARSLPAGSNYGVVHTWRRSRDNQILYTYSYTIADPGDYGYASWAWVYVYSYIGYVSHEIHEDGGYSVILLLMGGEEFYSRTFNFTITGVGEVTYEFTIGTPSVVAA